LERRLVQTWPDPEHPALAALSRRPSRDERRHRAPLIRAIVANGSSK
jgi:hypothetical protein